MNSAEKPTSFENVSTSEALQLIERNEVRVLDVRTPEEFEELGHIPGAVLLPMNLLPAGLATFHNDDRPLLICCEHGIRSVAAAEFLAHCGMPNLMNLAGGMSVWSGSRSHDPGTPFGTHGPSSWIPHTADLLPRNGKVLDVACGRGRHALLFAASGFEVVAVDHNEEAIKFLEDTAQRAALPLQAEVRDLEHGEADLGQNMFDVIVVVHYLHRPLFPALITALRPGGLLVYETFTVDQAARGKPTNPAFLLEHGELERLVEPLEVLRQRDGDFESRFVASIAARKKPENTQADGTRSRETS